MLWSTKANRPSSIQQWAINDGPRLPPPLVRRLGQLLIYESRQLRLAQGAYFGRSKLPVLEQHQRGNAANAELGRNIAVFIHVHLGNLQLPLVGCRHIVQNGRDHFAGAAPFSPVVHQHGLAGLKHVRFKRGVGDVFDEITGHGLTSSRMNDTVKDKIVTESAGRGWALLTMPKIGKSHQGALACLPAGHPEGIGGASS